MSGALNVLALRHTFVPKSLLTAMERPRWKLKQAAWLHSLLMLLHHRRVGLGADAVGKNPHRALAKLYEVASFAGGSIRFLMMH
jgi:hypothetical protein